MNREDKLFRRFIVCVCIFFVAVGIGLPVAGGLGMLETGTFGYTITSVTVIGLITVMIVIGRQLDKEMDKN